MELSSGGSRRSSSEMMALATQGQSSSSNSTSTHQWITTNTLELSVELEQLWRRWGQRMGIAGQLGTGTAARGLANRAAVS